MTWISCLAILLGAAVAGCNTPEIHPFTRVAYQEYAWLPQGDESTRTQALILMAGPNVSSSEFTAKVGVGTNLAAPDGDWAVPGVHVGSETYIWLDDEYKEYFYMSASLTRFEEGHEVYGYISWEKTW